MKPIVYIDGKEGTTGLQIYDRLARRGDIELLLIDEEKRKDTAERKRFINEADLVFLCLPDAAAIEAVGLVENPHTRGDRRLHRPPDGPGVGLRLSRAKARPAGGHCRRQAGGQPRLPRHRVYQHRLPPGGDGTPAEGCGPQLFFTHRLFRRWKKNDRPV